MKNLFTVDFANNTIIASKTTLKKAGVPNSVEYKALMNLMKQNPTFQIAEKEIKKAFYRDEEEAEEIASARATKLSEAMEENDEEFVE